MGEIGDIRIVKNELRKKYRTIREKMPKAEKSMSDNAIFHRLIETPMFLNAKTIFTFVSTEIEVDTIAIIETAFKMKKTVAVPKCLDKKGKMDFFTITSFNDLSPAAFGLSEPDENKTKRTDNYDMSICILPGFAFDKEGYRIGFGKGYYDRFLQNYTGVKIGICYNSCMASALPHGRYDAKANYIITPKYILSIK